MVFREAAELVIGDVLVSDKDCLPIFVNHSVVVVVVVVGGAVFVVVAVVQCIRWCCFVRERGGLWVGGWIGDSSQAFDLILLICRMARHML